MSTPWANENCWPVEVTHDGRPGCMQFLRCYSRISPTVNTVWHKSRESMSLYDALERNTWVAFTKIKAVHTRGAQAHDQFRIRESITITQSESGSRTNSIPQEEHWTKRAGVRAWVESVPVRGPGQAPVVPDLVPAQGSGRHPVRPPSAHVHVLA